MNPIKSARLKPSPTTKKLEKFGNKGVITSVHGIIHSDFPYFDPPLHPNQHNKTIQSIKEIKTIKLEMPILGLEHAVVCPKVKPSKLPLSKRILKKILRVPSVKEIKCEKKDTKSVTFLKELSNQVEDAATKLPTRSSCSIKVKPNISGDARFKLEKEDGDDVSFDEILFKTDSNTLFMRINNDILKENMETVEKTTPPLQMGSKKSSFESRIPKLTRVNKPLHKTTTKEELVFQNSRVETEIRPSGLSVKSVKSKQDVQTNCQVRAKSQTSQTVAAAVPAVSKIESTTKPPSKTSSRSADVKTEGKVLEKPSEVVKKPPLRASNRNVKPNTTAAPAQVKQKPSSSAHMRTVANKTNQNQKETIVKKEKTATNSVNKNLKKK